MSLSANINEKANLIWAIADKLTGPYKPHEYGKVILPLTVIRRFDCILAKTKQEVLAKHNSMPEDFPMREQFLKKASGYEFYNTSKYTFETLLDDAIELIMKSEGTAVTQKPSYKIDINVIDTIRQGIKENRKVRSKYNGKNKVLAPYGIIYGSNVYLIGVEGDWTNPYVYSLHKLTDVKLTNETFDKGDFDIRTYANNSFGVYQNEVMKVELLFSPEVKEDVLNFNFHPTQKVKENDDGTVTVKFKASGEL